MKKITVYLPLCICYMFFLIACEKAEIQQSTNKVEEQISVRTDDCTDCPIEDCCCRITYVSNDGASLEICGSTGARLSSRPCGSADPPGDDCPDVAATLTVNYLSLDKCKVNI